MTDTPQLDPERSRKNLVREKVLATLTRSGIIQPFTIDRATGVGALLVARGLLSRPQLDAALREQRLSGERLGIILTRNGLVSRSQMVDALAGHSPEALYMESPAYPRIPYEVLRKLGCMVLAEGDNTLYLAVDPSCKAYAGLDEAELRAYVYAQLSPYYPKYVFHFVTPDVARIRQFLREFKIRSKPGSMEWLLGEAVAGNASDIHLVPKNATYSVFLRRLGSRVYLHEGTPVECAVLMAQIKDLARMDIAERRKPQDGGFQTEVAGRLVGFRVATVPTIHGEYMVLRVLDPDQAARPLNDLGLTRVSHWRAGMRRAEGLCLVCGPTGSGKTSTINASIREVDRLTDAVFTAEDPVEHAMPYVGQVNIHNASGLSFTTALRAFMRADPDVLVVGEIRDLETAGIAMAAADTGHLVLATLHTGSIHGAVQRLKHLGVNPHDLRYILRSVLVQRLVRTLCPHCHGNGCHSCMNTGYGGRTLISECVFLDNENDVERLLNGETWWPSMQDDANAKVAAGLVSADDMERLFGQPPGDE